MAKILYVDRNFSAASRAIIETAEEICDEYAADGYTITLRQLYYQFVARDVLPNTQESYKRLGSVINDARLAGLLDWNHLEDRTRNLQGNAHWASPQGILEACASQFQLDKWATQHTHVEVWVEKEALAGIVERAARGLDVSFFSCRGYVSQSEMHAAALRFKQANRNLKAVRIIHLGDHDPSGIDMSRDIADRMAVFGVRDIEVDRIALNIDQVHQYTPPPNPAKATDARFTDYQAKFGDESWELDALEPRVLADLIRTAVLRYCVQAPYNRMVDKERGMKASLKACHDRWPEVEAFLGSKDAVLPDIVTPTHCEVSSCRTSGRDKAVGRLGVCADCEKIGWAACPRCGVVDLLGIGDGEAAVCQECGGE